jgi:hypothetical protein
MKKLDMGDIDDFDDVEIDTVPQLDHRPPAHSSLGYMYRVKRNGSKDSMKRSTTSLTNSDSYDTLNSHTRPTETLPVKQQVPIPRYSPSKKLKRNREIKKEDLEDMSTIDNTDDELDDSIIIYNVPLSQSLVQLTTHQKMVGQKLLSFNSDTTRNSSIMSYDHSHDINSDLELDVLSDDAKRLAYAFSQSESVLAAQESAMRRHFLSQMEKSPEIDESIPQSDLKQKYLSGTRPAHLPPKPRSEALRHSREVEQLKANAIKMELKNEKKRLKEIEKKNDIKSKDLRTWEKEIIPNFQENIKLSSTRELWWRGIPKQFRKWIWVELLEQKSLRPKLEQLKQSSSEKIKLGSRQITMIQNEIETTFPDLGVFQNDLSGSLLQVLVMYSELYQYEKGLCSLAAVLLYNIQSVEETFSSLCGLLNRHVLKSIYSNDMDSFRDEAASFLRTFAKLNPRLSDHLHKTLRLKPETYLTPLLKPAFTNLLNMEVSSAVLDVYLFEGDAFLWRCVLALFDKIGYRLYGDEQDVLDVIGWNAPRQLNKKKSELGYWYRYLDVGDEVDFLQNVRQVIKK